MNSIRLKCFLVLSLLSVIGFGPLSVTALIGLYVLFTRPPWFLDVVDGVYRDATPHVSAPRQPTTGTSAAWGTRFRIFLVLGLLMALDIAPVPVVGALGLYVVIRRPRWFADLVNRLYERPGESA